MFKSNLDTKQISLYVAFVVAVLLCVVTWFIFHMDKKPEIRETTLTQAPPVISAEDIGPSNKLPTFSNNNGLTIGYEAEKLKLKTAQISFLEQVKLKLPTAIIGLIAAIIGLIVVLLSARKSHKDKISKDAPEEKFFRDFFDGDDIFSRYVSYLHEIDYINKTENMHSACDKFIHLLNSIEKTILPKNLLNKGVEIITRKCKSDDEAMSIGALSCFEAFYNKIPHVSLDSLLDSLGEILNTKITTGSGRSRVIRAVFSLMSCSENLNEDNQKRYIAIMKEIFIRLSKPRNELDRETIIVVREGMLALRKMRDYQKVVEDILPDVTALVAVKKNMFLETYHSLIKGIGVFSGYNQGIFDNIYNIVEGWLNKINPDVDDTARETILPEIVHTLNPLRPVRPAFSRKKMNRTIRVRPNNDSSNYLPGFLKDISKTGVSFELMGTVGNGKKYTMMREKTDKGFLLRQKNKEIELGAIGLDIFNEGSSNDIDITVDCEMRRVWIPQQNFCTGFGAYYDNPSDAARTRIAALVS